MRIAVQSGSLFSPRYIAERGLVEGTPRSLEEGMRMLASAGFEGIDLNLNNLLPSTQIRAGETGGFFSLPEEEMCRLLQPYREAAEKYGLSFVQAHAPFPNYNADPGMQEYVRQSVEKSIMLCGYLHCPRLVVHGGSRPYLERMNQQEERAFNLDMYSSLIPMLKKHHVVCCLENLFSRYRERIMESVCGDPHDAIFYVDTLNRMAGEHCFGFCLDTGHVNLLSRDIYSVIMLLGDRIEALHINDNNGLEDEHLFPYMGTICWERFLQGLRDIGYAHDLSFETFHGLDTFDAELAPQLLDLLYATGAMFRRRIHAGPVPART